MIIGEPAPLGDDDPCPINGKYKGIPLGKVPAHFLDWFIGQPHLMRKYPAVVKYIERNNKAISQDLKQYEEDYSKLPEEDEHDYPRRFWDDEA